jgi:hypothetical protein
MNNGLSGRGPVKLCPNRLRYVNPGRRKKEKEKKKHTLQCLLSVRLSRPNRRLRSDDRNWVSCPVAKKKFGERGFSVAGPSAWNSLPVEVRTADSFNSFKAKLKKTINFHKIPVLCKCRHK